jgi:hypothetical protein
MMGFVEKKTFYPVWDVHLTEDPMSSFAPP